MTETKQTYPLAPDWEYVSDRVMGGVSNGALHLDGTGADRIATLTGAVSLDNDGGFVQMAFDVPDMGRGVEITLWRGIRFESRGNDQMYEVRLRTTDLSRPWQSFRTSFEATAEWHSHQMPFAEFEAHRTDADFDPQALRRVGFLAIGREFDADLSVRSLAFYR